jgi:hypothetical protein
VFHVGDSVLDIVGGALEAVNLCYYQAWGRPARPKEIEAVFNICLRPVQRGHNPTEWFPRFVDWLGIPPNEVNLYTETLRTLSWFYRTDVCEGSDDPRCKIEPMTDKTPEEHLAPYKSLILGINRAKRKYRGSDAEKDLRKRLEAKQQVILDDHFQGESGIFLSGEED